MKDRAIFLVTGKKITEMLIAERFRKTTYLTLVKRQVKKLHKDIDSIFWRDDSWGEGVLFAGVSLKKNVDKRIWKYCDHDTYVPKQNNREGKELYKKYKEATKKKVFFNVEEITSKLKYKPEKEHEFSATHMRVNSFKPGWTSKDEFFFMGYDGYIPPRGVKELTTTEYNKLIGE